MTYGINSGKGTAVSGSFIHGWLLPSDRVRLAIVWIVISIVTTVLNGCREKENILSPKEIVSFEIKAISAKGSIDNINGLIKIAVPYGTLLRNLVPDIQVTSGASIVPAASVPQDFTKPVFYTITGPDGFKRVYRVTILSSAQTAPEIEAVANDTVQAGDTLFVKGRHFGTFALAITTFLNDKLSGDETAVPFRLIDSTRIQIILPPSLKPSDYNVLVFKDKLKAVSKKSVNIRIHNPVITALRKSHLIQGDTVSIAGNFILPDQYKYTISIAGKNSYFLSPTISQSGKLEVVLTTEVIPGPYDITVINADEHTSSTIFSQPVVVYDAQLPFVREILTPKSAYTAGESIRFKTINFNKINARFYSIILSDNNKQYVQNAIFSHTDGVLSTTVLANIPASNYRIKIFFLDTVGSLIYEQEMDDRITIK